MSGRAGRRGKDDRGTVIVCADDDLDKDTCQGLMAVSGGCCGGVEKPASFCMWQRCPLPLSGILPYCRGAGGHVGVCMRRLWKRRVLNGTSRCCKFLVWSGGALKGTLPVGSWGSINPWGC